MSETKKTKKIQPEKAYKNLDFLNSKDARIVRILSEYLYPKAQFEEENIQNTIVIFGSARAPSPEDCLLYTSPSPRDLSTARMPSSA